jgi:quinol-cytochrome oxidoreductase complex cytochrome b subunit
MAENQVKTTKKIGQFFNIIIILIQIAISVLILIWNWYNGKAIKITNFISIGVMVIVLLGFLVLFLFVKEVDKTIVYERRLKVFRIVTSLFIALISIYYAIAAFINLQDEDKSRITNIISIGFAFFLFLINIIKFFSGIKKVKKQKAKDISKK